MPSALHPPDSFDEVSINVDFRLLQGMTRLDGTQFADQETCISRGSYLRFRHNTALPWVPEDMLQSPRMKRRTKLEALTRAKTTAT
jgi:hypothetical protein